MSDGNDTRDLSSRLEDAADPGDPSRRSFIQAGAGVIVGAAALVSARRQLRVLQADDDQTVSAVSEHRETSYADIELRINGENRRVRVPHQRTLLLALREDLGLTGTKKSCNLGQCGACTVLMDGLPVYACMLLALDSTGHDITTIEGLSKNGTTHPLQDSFVRHMGSQCGHCTPGMIMAGVALLESNTQPTPDDVKHALSGNLCRCGNYRNEIASVLSAAGCTPETTAGLPATARIVSCGVIGAEALVESHEGVLGKTLRSTVPVLDARAKASGAARYSGDIGFHPDDPPQGLLYAKVVRSPYALADVEEIDDSAARTLPGYRGMVTFRDVPGYQDAGRTDERNPVRSDRLFMNRRARSVGDAVAAVAADDEYTAQRALDLIRVVYEVHDALPDAEQNLADDNRTIHDDGAVAGFGGPQPARMPTVEYKRGDVERGFAQADLIVEGRYETPIQCHVPIEPHAVVALWQGERVTLWDSQQSVFAAQETIAHALGLDRRNVRVISTYVGGGFGGKCTDTPSKTLYQGIAALLARRTGRPVRLEYSLKELLFAEDTRNPFIFYLKTGVKKDGSMTAFECKAIARTGGYASSGPAVVSVAGQGMVATYRIPNYWYHGYCVYTSSPVGGEFRGFGHPQAVFARETHIDEVAAAIGMDPLEFRRRNSLHTGDLIDTDVVPNVPLMAIGAEACVQNGAEAIKWKAWQHPSTKTGSVRRGIGMRFSQEHSGRSASNGLVWMDKGGTIHVPIGSGNLGTNAHTGIALVVANALDMPVEKLDCTWGDSSTCTWDFVSDASRAVHCHGKAMYNAAIDLRQQILARRAGTNAARTDFTPHFDPATDLNPYLDESTGQVVKNPMPKLHEHTEALARQIVADGGLVGLGFYVWNPSAESWGASFAEVTVDMETGQVTVLTLVGAHDCGRVIHLPGALAQVDGGTIMGLGYAMTEELHIDPHTGIPVTQSLYEYRSPGVLDVPEIVPILVESPVPAGPFGAKGLGENPMFNAAAAVGNAIYNATGVRMREIPFTWPRVYDELKRAGKLVSRVADRG
jgi:CO/xanthine dehydrogenase Mo-binding subunit/aerobic-type carbon monoxide dehydrogenase small subunit (CoxS/CutS family)